MEKIILIVNSLVLFCQLVIFINLIKEDRKWFFFLLKGRGDLMELSIVETKDKNLIKIDDTYLSNVLSYAISSNDHRAEVTLVLAFPKDKVNVQVDYWLIQ